MILRLLNRFAERRRNFLIRNSDGTPYLLRFLLRGRLCGEPETGNRSDYLHRMYSADDDRLLHNHPWDWSYSLVIWGGYIEDRRQPDGRVVRRRLWPGMINVLGPMDFHRIVVLKGAETWTFFRAGKKMKDWGFLKPGDEFVPHRQHEAEKKGKTYQPAAEDLPDFVFTCPGCQRYFLRTAAVVVQAASLQAAEFCRPCVEDPFIMDPLLTESFRKYYNPKSE